MASCLAGGHNAARTSSSTAFAASKASRLARAIKLRINASLKAGSGGSGRVCMAAAVGSGSAAGRRAAPQATGLRCTLPLPDGEYAPAGSVTARQIEPRNRAQGLRPPAKPKLAVALRPSAPSFGMAHVHKLKEIRCKPRRHHPLHGAVPPPGQRRGSGGTACAPGHNGSLSQALSDASIQDLTHSCGCHSKHNA